MSNIKFQRWLFITLEVLPIRFYHYKCMDYIFMWFLFFIFVIHFYLANHALVFINFLSFTWSLKNLGSSPLGMKVIKVAFKAPTILPYRWDLFITSTSSCQTISKMKWKISCHWKNLLEHQKYLSKSLVFPHPFIHSV